MIGWLPETRACHCSHVQQATPPAHRRTRASCSTACAVYYRAFFFGVTRLADAERCRQACPRESLAAHVRPTCCHGDGGETDWQSERQLQVAATSGWTIDHRLSVCRQPTHAWLGYIPFWYVRETVTRYPISRSGRARRALAAAWVCPCAQRASSLSQSTPGDARHHDRSGTPVRECGHASWCPPDQSVEKRVPSMPGTRQTSELVFDQVEGTGSSGRTW